ncbi:MAG: hypothetical protein DRP11_04795 [Candidatus Aenigmatarchaeota archaeon]|nr:MAG: hypothetical protein DRP11_04795 [Candidatus Aenigmarchaeota archaeon]
MVDEGAHTIYVWLKDRVGNVDYHNRASIILYYDATPPLAPNELMSDGLSPSPWKNVPSFTIDWSNPADIGGVAGAWYKLGAAPTSSEDGIYTTDKPFTVTVNSEGGQILYVWLEDKAGNKSHINNATVTLRYDRTAPSAPTDVIADGSTPSPWKKVPSFTIEWTNPYDLSGVIGVWYKLGEPPIDSKDGRYTTSKPFTVTVDSEGVQTLYIWLEDKAGNRDHRNNASVALCYDRTAPLAPTGITPYPSVWTSTNFFTITWANPSDASGIAGAFYKLDSEPTDDTDGIFIGRSGVSSISDITVPTEGEHIIYVWLKDGAGNVSYVNWGSTSLRYDATPPPAPISLTADGSNPSPWKNTPSFTIDWVNPPDSSGIAGAWYELSESKSTINPTGEIYTTNKPFIVTVSAEGTHNLHVWLQDSTGNKSCANEVTVLLRYDTTPPSIPSLISPTDSSFAEKVALLDWKDATDGGSGMSNYVLVIDNDFDFSSPEYIDTTVTSEINLNIDLKPGTYYWKVKAKDNAGNFSNWSTIWNFTLIKRLVSLEVLPSDTTVSSGETIQYVAIGYNTVGDRVKVEPSWRVLGDIGTIDQTGLFKAIKVGTGSVVVSVDGLIDTASVTVVPGKLASIKIFPDSAIVASGTTQQFTVTGYDMMGNPVVITEQLFWRLSDSGLGTITSSGLFTAGEISRNGFVIVSVGDISAMASVSVVDTVRPYIISTSPAPDVEDVPVDATIAVSFSEDMDADSLSNSAVIVIGSKKGKIEGGLTYRDRTIYFTPKENLEFNEEVTVVVSASLKDLSGNSLNKDYVFSFTTERRRREIVYNYPNPVRGDETTFRYYLNYPADVVIQIFDLSGDFVDELRVRATKRGYNEVRWSLSGISPGVYNYIFRAEYESGEVIGPITKRILVLGR